MKSVKSINPFKSLPCRQAGVIQTSYDIIKAHGGVPIAIPIAIGIKVETNQGEGSEFIISLPASSKPQAFQKKA